MQVLRAQLELGQVRQEIDRRIQEKEEEFDNTRSVFSDMEINISEMRCNKNVNAQRRGYKLNEDLAEEK